MFFLRALVLSPLLPALKCAAATAVFTSPSSISDDADGNNSAPWTTNGTTPVSLEFDTSALIPTGAVINSVTIRANGTAIEPSYRSEIDLSITDPTGNTDSWDFGTDLSFANSGGDWDSGDLTASLLAGEASGVFTLSFSEDYNDDGIDNSVAAVTLTVDYTLATSTFSASVGAYLNGIMPVTDPTNGGAQPPATLSATGAFTDLGSLAVASGLVPYEVNSPLWSDGAQKMRWIAIPSDGNRDSAGEQIVFNPDAPWTFPAGTVAVKHFELPTNANNPNELRRLETRFLVAIGNGDFYGVSYRWRADGSEADLLPDGASDTFNITNSDGSISSQTWDYPSRQDCRSCHNLGSGVFLGVNTWQLNGNTTYPGESSLQNQLEVWSDESLFTTSLEPAANYPAGVAVEDATASLEKRMRSYLAANCANCHNPASGLNTSFDLRFDTTLADTGLIYGSLLYDLGIDGANVITPQEPETSILYQRMDTVEIHKMPPIGRNVIDEAAVTTLNQWIMTLNTAASATSNPPLANEDEGLTQSGQAIAINAFANDEDVDGDSFSLLQSSEPSHGTISWDNNGVVTYTPESGFVGSDEFSYQITDSTGSVSQAATVRIIVTAASSSNSVTFTQSSDLLVDPTSYSGVAMAVVDMNQDGRDDIVRLRAARNLFIDYQNTNGTFSPLSLGTPSNALQWGLAVGDTDNNGFPDLITGGFKDGLHYQQANSSGTSYAKTTLDDPEIFLQAVSFADIDNDGWLDLFPCHDLGNNPPFRNTGDGSLVHDPSLIDTSTTRSSDNSGNYGVVWTDYDNDGDIDLYISKCRLGVSSRTDPRRVNQLFRNNGDGTFTEVAAAAGLADGAQSWTADFADIDNDGDLDCFIGNHMEASRLMRNDGDGTFTEVTSTSGISVTWNVIQAIFRDFNNDGWIDLLLTGTQQGLWINDRDGSFTKLSNPFISRAMESAAVGDLNHDGFPDIYAGYASIYNSPQSSRPDQLFLSNSNDNGFLSMTLKGRSSNKLASGAVLELHGPWGVQMREVRSGEGYGITHSFSQRFGMGNTAVADRLVVRWPSGTIDTAFNVATNQFLTLSEGDTAPPTLSNPGDRSSASESVVSLQLTASDPHQNLLTYSASNLPTGLSINSSTGRISGITATVAGVFNVTVSVSDGWTTIGQDFIWTIEGASNTGPTLAAIDDQVSGVSEAVSLNLSANDSDGDDLTFSAAGLPAGLTISSQTGVVSGAATDAGSFNVTISVSDGILDASRSFTWTVESPGINFAFGGNPPNLPARIQGEHFDTGGAGVSYYDVDSSNIGGLFRSSGVDLTDSLDTDGTPSVSWIENAEWTEYTVNVTPGAYDITARIASAETAPGLIRVLLDDRELGFITVTSTGDWHSWQNVSLQNVSVTESGTAILRLEYIGGPYNLNWIEFTENTTGGGGGPVTQRPFLEVAASLPGRIQSENYDLGGPGVAYQDTEPANRTGSYRSEGVDIEPSNDIDGSFSLSWFDANEWIEYTVLPKPGIYTITVRTAAGDPNPGDLRVLLDGEELTTFDIPDTGSPTSWASTSVTGITLTGNSEQVLRVETVGSGVNFNWIEFTRTSNLPGTPPATDGRSEASLLAMAFGSWDGIPGEGELPQLSIINEGESTTSSLSFLVRLGGWLTETGYTSRDLSYRPLTSENLENWGPISEPLTNPEGLPTPPLGYKYLTYSRLQEPNPKAFFKVDLVEN